MNADCVDMDRLQYLSIYTDPVVATFSPSIADRSELLPMNT